MLPGASPNVQPRKSRAKAVPRRMGRDLEFNSEKGMMDMDADMGLLVIAIMITVCALGFSIPVYLRSARIADPDPERLRRFIESAPMDRLKPVGGGEPETPQDETDGEVSDDRDRAARGSRRVIFRLNGSLSVEIGSERGPASREYRLGRS